MSPLEEGGRERAKKKDGTLCRRWPGNKCKRNNIIRKSPFCVPKCNNLF